MKISFFGGGGVGARGCFDGAGFRVRSFFSLGVYWFGFALR